MNAIHLTPATGRTAATPARAIPVPLPPMRHIHRERDFGVGYGNSSGYASARHYADHREQPRFRCV
ncbi:MAG: hypothetical protein ACYC42_01680 [Lysobacter sp.]